MLGGTAPRVISSASLGGPGLNQGRLASAMHRATLVVLGPYMFGWQATVKNALSAFHGLVTEKRHSKLLFSLDFQEFIRKKKKKWIQDYTHNFHLSIIINVATLMEHNFFSTVLFHISIYLTFMTSVEKNERLLV